MATLSPLQVYAVAREAGATHDEAVILTAIAKGESGWRTDAHNPIGRDNSYGLWQINMLGDMGAARRQTFGIQTNEELFDPRVNARAAIAILRSQGWDAWTVYSKGIYRQHMPEAEQAGRTAAPVWQSILQNSDFSDAGLGTQISPNSGGAQVGDIIGGMDLGVFAAGGGVPPLPENASPEEIEAHIAENFPQAAGFLGIPEIRTILIEAARNQWLPAKLQAEIQATTWWRMNSATTRHYYALKTTDPAQFADLVSEKAAELAAQIAPLGINLGGPEGVEQWAENAIKYGWTPEQTTQKLAQQLRKQSGRSGFVAGSQPDLSADQLMEIARNEYFVPISRMDAERWAVDIFNGSKTEDSLRDYFARLAESRFPGLSEQGFTPGEYMAPVKNLIAQTLELNPVDVDLLDPRWSEVLETQGKEGRFRPMTLGEAGRWARSQQEYRQTDQAQREAAGLAETLMQTFGAV